MKNPMFMPNINSILILKHYLSGDRAVLQDELNEIAANTLGSRPFSGQWVADPATIFTTDIPAVVFPDYTLQLLAQVMIQEQLPVQVPKNTDTHQSVIKLIHWLSSIFEPNASGAPMVWGEKDWRFLKSNPVWLSIWLEGLTYRPNLVGVGLILTRLQEEKYIWSSTKELLIRILHERGERATCVRLLESFLTVAPLEKEEVLPWLRWLHAGQYQAGMKKLAFYAVLHADTHLIEAINAFLSRIAAWELMRSCAYHLLNQSGKEAGTSKVGSHTVLMLTTGLVGMVKSGLDKPGKEYLRLVDELGQVVDQYYLELPADSLLNIELLKVAHLINYGSAMERLICDRYSPGQIEKLIQKEGPGWKVIQARSLELTGQWQDAYPLWRTLLIADPEDTGLLRFAAINSLQLGTRLRQASEYGLALIRHPNPQICAKGWAIRIAANPLRYREIIGWISEQGLLTMQDDWLFDQVRRLFINALLNDAKGRRDFAALFTEKTPDSAGFQMLIPLEERLFLQYFIKLEHLLKRAIFSSEEINHALNLIKAALRLKLDTTKLIATANLAHQLLNHKARPFSTDDFGDFESSEIGYNLKILNWLLVFRAEQLLEQVGNQLSPARHTELSQAIQELDIRNASNTLQPLDRLSRGFFNATKG